MFEPPAWQPRLRCPHCGTLGYPDRSGHNLLSLAWECPACGATNDGSASFCLACGVGLASRCLRCERPIYTAVCLHCGAHQARLSRLQSIDEAREMWSPVLRQYVEQARTREEIETTHRYDPSYGVREWRTIDQSMREAADKRQQRYAAQRAVRRPRRMQVWGWLALIFGAVWLISANYDQIVALLGSLAAVVDLTDIQTWYTVELEPLARAVAAALQSWWTVFSLTLSRPPGPDDAEYVYLFATAIFGLALLPLLLYVLARVIRRLFP